jgi:hypothetical protein
MSFLACQYQLRYILSHKALGLIQITPKLRRRGSYQREIVSRRETFYKQQHSCRHNRQVRKQMAKVLE